MRERIEIICRKKGGKVYSFISHMYAMFPIHRVKGRGKRLSLNVEFWCARPCKPYSHKRNDQKTSPLSTRQLVISDLKQLTPAKVCRNGLTNLIIERGADDHATTDVTKVSVAPRRDALPEMREHGINVG